MCFGFDHINRNAPVLIRTPKLTRFEPAQYWGGGPPGNSVVLNPIFFFAVLHIALHVVKHIVLHVMLHVVLHGVLHGVLHVVVLCVFVWRGHGVPSPASGLILQQTQHKKK